jgi:HEPN domain-containing protein
MVTREIESREVEGKGIDEEETEEEPEDEPEKEEMLEEGITLAERIMDENAD